MTPLAKYFTSGFSFDSPTPLTEYLPIVSNRVFAWHSSSVSFLSRNSFPNKCFVNVRGSEVNTNIYDFLYVLWINSAVSDRAMNGKWVALTRPRQKTGETLSLLCEGGGGDQCDQDLDVVKFEVWTVECAWRLWIISLLLSVSREKSSQWNKQPADNHQRNWPALLLSCLSSYLLSPNYTPPTQSLWRSLLGNLKIQISDID